MQRFAILSIAFAPFVSVVLAQSPEPAKNHEWLKQLVGEWDTQCNIYMQPDQTPTESSGTDTVRALGDQWVVAELNTTMMGAPYTGMLSLGYDSQKQHFHGTWIDSFGCQLWVYKGTLNDAGDTLTLETEGPNMESPDKTARYKEVIQITGKDSRTFTSSTESDDGTWKKILTIEYRRKK